MCYALTADFGDSGADEVGAEEDVQRFPVGGSAAAGRRHHCQSAELLQVGHLMTPASPALPVRLHSIALEAEHALERGSCCQMTGAF